MTRRFSPGPAPAFQARWIDLASSASSCRTCPNVNARKNVPNVDGAAIQPPNSRPVAARPQHIAVIDAISTQNHREHQRHDLAPCVRSPGTIAPQPHQIPRHRLDPEAPSERRDEHHASVRNDALIIKNDLDPVQSDRPVIVHCTTKVTSRCRPRLPRTAVKALHWRSFFFTNRTEPAYSIGGSGIRRTLSMARLGQSPRCQATLWATPSFSAMRGYHPTRSRRRLTSATSDGGSSGLKGIAPT